MVELEIIFMYVEAKSKECLFSGFAYMRDFELLHEIVLLIASTSSDGSGYRSRGMLRPNIRSLRALDTIVWAFLRIID